MVSYAYSRGCNNVLLLYPNTSENLADDPTFTIPSGFGKNKFKVRVCEVPFWSSSDHREVEEKLQVALTKMLNNTTNEH